MIERLQDDAWQGQGVDAVRPTWHDAARDAIRHRLAARAGRAQRWLANAKLLLKKGKT